MSFSQQFKFLKLVILSIVYFVENNEYIILEKKKLSKKSLTLSKKKGAQNRDRK